MMTMDDVFDPQFNPLFHFPELENFFSFEETSENDELLQETSENDENSRFKNLSNEEVMSLKKKSVNDNTAKTTTTWYNTYKSWAKERKEREDIENLPPEHLNLILERFYAELCKQDRSDYEPESLAVMQASLDRYLKERNYPISIVRGTQFTSSNSALKGKACQLREKGKGGRPNSAKPLTRSDEDELWQAGKLGTGDPESLIFTLFGIL